MGHPEPISRLERDGRVGRDDARVVDSIEADGVSRRLVVVVPRELDGAVAIVLLAGGARDTGQCVVVSVLVNLLHILPT